LWYYTFEQWKEICVSEITSGKIIESKILIIRGKKVMLDRDLAKLYGTETRKLKQAVKRNIRRFPDDFMFQLNEKEIDFLLSQSVIPSKKVLGGAVVFVFTEQGVAMLSTVLSSEKAIAVNIQIMRTFTKLREMITNNELLREKIENLENKYKQHDQKFTIIFDAIRKLIEPQTNKEKKEFGFRVKH